MSTMVSLYNSQDNVENVTDWGKAQERKIAVEAALDLIKAKALGGNNTSGDLEYLSEYADKIQEALEKIDHKNS